MNYEFPNSPEMRMAICRECPLFLPQRGGICNDRLWLNPETDDISLYKKDGYVRGCHCLLESKVKNESSVCPAGKW